MAWSGVLIYWAHQAYLPIPKFLVEKLHLHHRLAEGMGWHFLMMWFFTINGLAYIFYLGVSGEWKKIIPNKKDFKEIIPYILHDLKILGNGPAPRGPYNPAQKLAYTSAILMGVGLSLTGLAIYKPVQMGWITNLLGGYEAARFEHFALLISLSLFFVVHIIQVIRAGWSNFASMVAGSEIEKE